MVTVKGQDKRRTAAHIHAPRCFGKDIDPISSQGPRLLSTIRIAFHVCFFSFFPPQYCMVTVSEKADGEQGQ